jgi:hypothetical protein
VRAVELKVEKLVDVECAGLVGLIEVAIACLMHFAVQRTFLDEKPGPLEIAVAGEEGVVEIKQCEAHGLLAGPYCGYDAT